MEKYFMFSTSQLKIRRDIETSMGKKYVPPTVIVGGVPKQYTEIVDDPVNASYPDALIVTSGETDKMRYTKE